MGGKVFGTFRLENDAKPRYLFLAKHFIKYAKLHCKLTISADMECLRLVKTQGCIKHIFTINKRLHRKPPI
jgi:hypothetical protein